MGGAVLTADDARLLVLPVLLAARCWLLAAGSGRVSWAGYAGQAG